MRKKKKGGFGCVCKETQNLKLRWWKRIKFETIEYEMNIH